MLCIFQRSIQEEEEEEEEESCRMRTLMAPQSPSMASLLIISSTIFLSSFASSSSSGSFVGITCHDSKLASFLREANTPPWVSVDLSVDEFDAKEQPISPSERVRLLNTMIRGSAVDLPSLLPALEQLQGALGSSDTGHGAKLSVVFPPQTSEMPSKRAVGEVMDTLRFLKETDTSMAFEVHLKDQLSLEEDSAQSVTQRAVDLCSLLPRIGVPIVLFLKSSRVISSAEGPEEDQLLYHSYQRRKLLGHDSKIVAGRKAWLRDTVAPVFNPAAPVFNPVTTPSVNVPSTNPSPAVITVPSTDPGSIMPTTPISVLPSTNPFSPAANLPGMNPVTTTPITNPTNPFTTNPATMIPFLPATGIPSVTPNPGTFPVSGQSWCVARAGVPDSSLQSALDYACGSEGTDCGAIQTTGSCYSPNSLQSHASYAFNSYYQRNPVATSCDFGGTATIIGINPSSGTCLYPFWRIHSSTSVFNPASTAGAGVGVGAGASAGVTGSGAGYAAGFGAGSGSNSGGGGSSTVFGSDSSDGGRGRRNSSSGQPLRLFLAICLLQLLHL